MKLWWSPYFKLFVSGTLRRSALSYSPDGQQIVSGSHDKTVKIWDASEEAE